MAGGEKSDETFIILKEKHQFDKDFLDEIMQKRMKLISNIVCRILGGELGL